MSQHVKETMWDAGALQAKWRNMNGMLRRGLQCLGRLRAEPVEVGDGVGNDAPEDRAKEPLRYIPGRHSLRPNRYAR